MFERGGRRLMFAVVNRTYLTYNSTMYTEVMEQLLVA